MLCDFIFFLYEEVKRFSFQNTNCTNVINHKMFFFPESKIINTIHDQAILNIYKYHFERLLKTEQILDTSFDFHFKFN